MTPRLTRLIWILVAVVVLGAIVVAVTLSGGGSPKATATEQAPVTVTGTPLPALPAAGADPAVGETIPSLTGRSVFDGKPLAITADGKPQLLAFVAHWCPHCNNEVPVLVDLGKHGVFDGVHVTAIATGTNPGYPNYPPSHWLKSTMHWPYPALADSKTYAAARAYGLTAYPFLVFVDGQGKVVARTEGELASSDLRAYVSALKAGKPITLGQSGSSSAAG